MTTLTYNHTDGTISLKLGTKTYSFTRERAEDLFHYCQMQAAGQTPRPSNHPSGTPKAQMRREQARIAEALAKGEIIATRPAPKPKRKPKPKASPNDLLKDLGLL